MKIRPGTLFSFLLPAACLSFTFPHRRSFTSYSKTIDRWQLADNNNNSGSNENEANEQVSRVEAVRKLLRQEQQEEEEEDGQALQRRDLIINLAAGGLLVASGVAASQLYKTTVYTPTGFQRFSPTQFIAALGDPNASEGIIEEPWGRWSVDPGPRGVWLRDFDTKLQQSSFVAPAGWTFDKDDWWLEEHGLIMEKPVFPLASGRYLVTGGRSVTTGLTITGNQWKLDEGTLFDVTHLPCRAARYKGGSPTNANQRDFPVQPGATMPAVTGADKQDYAVLFLVGKAER